MSHLALIIQNRKLKFIVLSLFFLALTVLLFRNIFDGPYLTGTDAMSTVYGPNMQAAGGSFFSAWDYFTSAGVLNYPLPAYAASNALVIGALNVPAADWAKLQLLGGFWLTGMLAFYVLRAMTSSDRAAFLGSLVYLTCGAFVEQVVEGHIGFVIAYPFLILIFYLFHDAYNNGITKKTVLLPALLLVYGGSAAPHMVLLAAVMMISYAAFDLIYRLVSRRRDRTLYRIVLTVLLAAVLVLPMAYMMLALGGSNTYETSYTLEQAAGASDSLLAAIGLGGSELTNTYAYFGPTAGPALNYAIQILAIPLFFFALLSLFVDKYRKLIIPLWLAVALNIFLSMGPNGPLGFAFTFLFDNVPLVDSFRALSRFSMINAVFYSVMIAVTVANWGEVSEKTHRLKAKFLETASKGRWIGKDRATSKIFPAALAAVLVIASLSGLAVLANGEVIRGFDVPEEYSEPFEYIQAVDGNGQYKIFTLPMIDDVYQHPTTPSISGYGYPKGTTLDPGTYLTAMINEKAMSHSLSAPNYWSGMRTIMEDRYFGYQDTLDLLGGSAGVKYVVDQWYAPEEDQQHFADLNNGTVLVTYPSGAKVIEVNSFSSPLKAQNGLILASGGLATMYLLLGAGVFDPSSDAYSSFAWSDGEDVGQVLGASDLVVVQNGDLVELGYELGYLDGMLLDLPDQVNEHREDAALQWVQSVDTGMGEMSVVTSGPNTLTVHPDQQVDAGSSLMIRALFGPDEGVLHVTINGDIARDIDLTAPFTGTEWVTIDLPADVDSVDSISFTGPSDGKEVAVSDAAIFDSGSEAALTSQMTELLSPYADKVGYAYTPLDLYLQDRSAELGNWTLGNGLTSQSAIGVNMSTLFDHALNLSVYAPDWGAKDIALDGSVISGQWNSSGAYRYDLGTVAAGQHDLQLFPDGLYGMTLLPDYTFNKVTPTITYERVSPTEYRVSVTNASGPFILKFSEGESEFWQLSGGDASTTWFRSDYLANAFVVNGTGSFDMTLSFSKQAGYDAFLYLYAFAIVASTLAAAGAYTYTRTGLQERRKKPLGAKREQQ